MPTVMLEWGGVKLGLLGLAEGEWVDTLGVVEPEDVTYHDFVEEGRRLAKQLRVSLVCQLHGVEGGKKEGESRAHIRKAVLFQAGQEAWILTPSVHQWLLAAICCGAGRGCGGGHCPDAHAGAQRPQAAQGGSRH